MAQYGANKGNPYNPNKWTFEASEEVKAKPAPTVKVIKEQPKEASKEAPKKIETYKKV